MSQARPLLNELGALRAALAHRDRSLLLDRFSVAAAWLAQE